MNMSPKAESSTSQQLIERCIPFIKGNEYGILPVNSQMVEDVAIQVVQASDAIVIVSPIYCSGLPSSALALMDIIEGRIQKRKLTVGAILQCGFYESSQTQFAMRFIKLWCDRNEYSFVGGMGIGGGPAIQSMQSIQTGTMFLRPLKKAYIDLANALQDGKKRENYFSIGMPRWVYRAIVEKEWKKEIVAAGLKKEDLASRPNE